MIVIVKKCVIPPPPITSFDSGPISTDAQAAYQAIYDYYVTQHGDFNTLPPSFVQVPDIPDPGGVVSYPVAVGLLGMAAPNQVNGEYQLPLYLKSGVWSCRLQIGATSSNTLPPDDEDVAFYRNIYSSFYASGFLWTDPGLPFLAQDGGPLSLDFTAGIQFFDRGDPCYCFNPTQQALGWAESDTSAGHVYLQMQSAEIHFTGHWISDLPPP